MSRSGKVFGDLYTFRRLSRSLGVSGGVTIRTTGATFVTRESPPYPTPLYPAHPSVR